MAFHYTMKNMKYIAYERFDGNIRLVEKENTKFIMANFLTRKRF